MGKKRYKRVLTIAGSDSGGGAGIQADIKTISALGCYAASAITAITIQNTVRVSGIQFVEPKTLEGQIELVMEDIGADAIKIGMLGTPELASCTAKVLRKYSHIPIVLDPVLIATVGESLSTENTEKVILELLMPLATVITPNLDEAIQMTGYSDHRAWEVFHSKGAKALLLKDGHGTDPIVIDRLYTPSKVYEYRNERINTRNTHGTGCTLSSAIAAYIAHGHPLEEAVARAVKYVHKALGTAMDYELGKGVDPVHHFFKYW